MSEIADFLRARYQEARSREEGRRRMKFPDPFDGHEVSVDSDGSVLVDDREYPAEKYWEIASEPGADPFVLADLDAKLGIVEWHAAQRDDVTPWGKPVQICYCGYDLPCRTLRYLAQPFAGHPDHKGEEWAP